MMMLKDILKGMDFKILFGDLDQPIHSIQFDSRKADESSLFVAITGTHVDGHDYIESAYKQGCRVFIVENKDRCNHSDCHVVKVIDSSMALGIVASNFFGNPSAKLKLIGITGTNGKTTCCTLLHDLFENLGYKSGLISTVVNKVSNEEIESTHTTPDPIQLNLLLAKMVEQNCDYCFMEVSSHAIHQNRIHGLRYSGAAFTNITHDHLDYHKTFREYLDVKKQFFDGLQADAFALSNADDKNGEFMLQNTKAKKLFYALKTHADFKAKILESSFSGLILKLENLELYSRLIGSFNASNILVIYGVAISLGISSNEVMTCISRLGAVDGRFECVKSKGNIIAIIDYAHTPDALENILNTINDIKHRSQKLISIVGCGGDRDKDKRPIMGEIASRNSETLILTSDNPRTENPQLIIDDIEKGVQENSKSTVLQILNRHQAIKTAVKVANEGDIILIAGKGHEKYQEIDGVRHEFDDVQVVKEMFNQMKK